MKLTAVLLSLLLAACASTSGPPTETLGGTLFDGASLQTSGTDRPTRSIRLIDGDLQIRVGDSSVTLLDAAPEGRLDYRRLGDAWILELSLGEATWEGRVLRLGPAAFELERGERIVIDADGRRLPDGADPQ